MGMGIGRFKSWKGKQRELDRVMMVPHEDAVGYGGLIQPISASGIDNR